MKGNKWKVNEKNEWKESGWSSSQSVACQKFLLLAIVHGCITQISDVLCKVENCCQLTTSQDFKCTGGWPCWRACLFLYIRTSCTKYHLSKSQIIPRNGLDVINLSPERTVSLSRVQCNNNAWIALSVKLEFQLKSASTSKGMLVAKATTMSSSRWSMPAMFNDVMKWQHAARLLRVFSAAAHWRNPRWRRFRQEAATVAMPLSVMSSHQERSKSVSWQDNWAKCEL